MAEVLHDDNSSKHFMGLSDGFPIPKDKQGALQQILGLPFLFKSVTDNEDESEDELTKNSKSATVSMHNSFNSKLAESITPAKSMNEIFLVPPEIGLIPVNEWSPRPVTLEQIKNSYFTRRNGNSRSFDIKLYNALCISRFIDGAEGHIGVAWIDSDHFKVNEKIFSKFIGGKSENSTLFDKQGPFEKYGFEQVFKGMDPKFSKNHLCNDVDDNEVRIFKDSKNRFSRDKPYALVF